MTKKMRCENAFIIIKVANEILFAETTFESLAEGFEFQKKCF